MSASGVHKEDSDLFPTVTEEDIRLFRCTLLARRFPGLRELLDEDIKLLILTDRKAAERKRKALQKTHPNSDFAPPAQLARERPASTSTPFRPVNQAEAKHTLQRPNDECFIGIGTPFESEHSDSARDAVSDMSKRGLSGPFSPNSASQAKAAIQVDYYLNSHDSATKQSQKALMDQRASLHKEQYRELYQSRRGKTLMS